VDVVAESIRSCAVTPQAEPQAEDSALKWDYNLEDRTKHAGFRGRRTFSRISTEAKIFRPGPKPETQLPGNQERPRLSNGARYLQRPRSPGILPLPKCKSLRDLIAQTKPGAHHRGVRPAPQTSRLPAVLSQSLHRTTRNFRRHTFAAQQLSEINALFRSSKSSAA